MVISIVRTYKTTVKINEERRKQIRKYITTLNGKMTIDKFINDVIDDFFIENHDLISEKNLSNLIDENEFAHAIVLELKDYYSDKCAKTLLVRCCAKKSILPEDISPETITEELLDDLCTSIAWMSTPEKTRKSRELLGYLLKTTKSRISNHK